MARLEHANLIVRDLEAELRFIQTAFPEFEVRAEGQSWTGARWLHVGTDDTYLALNEATEEPAEAWVPYAGKPGLNHLGYEVEDAAALRERMRAAGYRDSTVPNEHPHRRRVYFHDPEGNDWEFVEYLSDDPRERNDYGVPDVT
ncbi:MAG: VOC family protein [Myxococcota bacterium]|nr:VOC family protein [Myxococcota bacterium]